MNDDNLNTAEWIDRCLDSTLNKGYFSNSRIESIEIYRTAKVGEVEAREEFNLKLKLKSK